MPFDISRNLSPLAYKEGINTGMKLLRYPIAFLLLLSAFLACKKESFITSSNATISISTDSLRFDTVFTTAGSITQSFTVVNTNTQKLRLSAISLAGGNASAFKINVDGFSGPEIHDIDIEANDSIYVFVSVTIQPSAANLPFLVLDSLQFSFNGNVRKVQLEAYGQNAHFLKSQLITGSVNWSNDLPYVILGGLLIDSNAILTVNEGCRIYLHADAPFIVDGSLQCNGTKSDSIIFQGDRLDQDYRDLPASWPGIYFRSNSRNNVLTHTIIKNAYQGLIADAPSTNGNPKLALYQCVVDNIYDIGILALNSRILAENCLVTNCGSNIVLARGGEYQFTHCTVASYGNLYLDHKNPVLYLNNWDSSSGSLITYSMNAAFLNCIFWGDNGTVDDELILSRKGNNNFSVLLDHDLYKAKNDPTDALLNNIIRNQDPLFDSISVNTQYFDFHIGLRSSPAIGAGIPTSVTTDLDDKARPASPTLGCYEK